MEYVKGKWYKLHDYDTNYYVKYNNRLGKWSSCEHIHISSGLYYGSGTFSNPKADFI